MFQSAEYWKIEPAEGFDSPLLRAKIRRLFAHRGRSNRFRLERTANEWLATVKQPLRDMLHVQEVMDIYL